MCVTAEAGEKLLLITSDTELGGPSPSAASPPPCPCPCRCPPLLSPALGSSLLAPPGGASRVPLPRGPGLARCSRRRRLRSSSFSSLPPRRSGQLCPQPSSAQTRPRRPRSPARGRAHGHAHPREPTRTWTHARSHPRARGHARPRTPPRPAPGAHSGIASRASGRPPCSAIGGSRSLPERRPHHGLSPSAPGSQCGRLGAHGQARARAHTGTDTRGHTRVGHALPRRRRSPAGKSGAPRALPGPALAAAAAGMVAATSWLFRRLRDRWGVRRQEGWLASARVPGKRVVGTPGEEQALRNWRGSGEQTSGA